MKYLLTVILLASAAFSQSTILTGTITDPDGQTWNNGTYTINFVPTPGSPGPFSWNGTLNFPQKFSGNLDNSGNISITIPDNNFVKPLGTQWRFTLCSNTSAPCQDVVTPVSGASLNMSGLLSVPLIAPRFGPGQFSRGYQDIEATAGALLQGMTYYNVSTGFLRVWNGTIWTNISGGGSTPPGGVTTNLQFNNAGAFGGAPDVTYTTDTNNAGELDVSNLANIRIVTAKWNWFQFPTDNLSVAGTNTITLTPCPLGIDTSGSIQNAYAVYISAVGTPEAAYVTGGTCTPGLASGTIIVRTQNSHSAGYTVGSATSGIQEAYNDAGGAGTTLYLEPRAPNAGANYTIYSTFWQQFNKSTIKGNKALIKCNTRDRCIGSGVMSGGSGSHNIIEDVEFMPGLNIDGVQISAVKANAGRYTVTTTTPHPFTNSGVTVSVSCPSFFTDPFNNPCLGLDMVILSYSVPASTQELRVQVLTGSNCANGSGTAGACNSNEFEYAVGNTTFASSSGFGWAALENTAIEDIGQGQTFRSISYISTGNTAFFSWGVVIGNDQAMTIDNLDTNATGVKCDTANFCGAVIYARGDQGASPVLWVQNANISLQCHGNGVRYASGNGMNIKNSVIQGFDEYGAYYGGGLQQWTIGPLAYEESGACTNHKYTNGTVNSQIGYISGGPLIDIVDNTAIGGAFPTFPAQNVGATQQNYYVVMKSAGNVATPAMYVGSCLTAGTGNCTVMWPSPSLDTIPTLTMDVLRVTGVNVNPPYTGNANSVATGLTFGGSCTTTGICTFVDPQSGTSAYTLNAQSANPVRFTYWPGAVLLSNASKLELQDCGGSGIIATTFLPSVSCSGVSGVGSTSPSYSPNFTQISNTAAANGVGISRVASRGNAAGAGTGGLKGIFDQIDFNGVPQGDLWTLEDSNYPKTLATPNYRPTADTNDTAIGFDSPQPTAANLSQLAVRSPVAISNYIANTFDNTSYLERLTATLKSFTVPVTMFSPAVALGGTFGFGPFNPVSPPYTACLTGSGANMTPIAGSFSYSSGVATWATGDGFAMALSACTGSSFTANQSMQVKNVNLSAGQSGVSLRGSTTPGVYTRYEARIGAGSWTIAKCNAANTCTTLNSGSGTFTNGSYISGFVSGSSTVTVSLYDNGNLVGTGTDSSSPILAGNPGIEAITQGSFTLATAVSQDYSAASNIVVGGSFKISPTTFANLPTCNGGAEGTMVPVTDSNTAVFNAIIAGGGTNHMMGYCNGTNWVAH